MTTALHAPINGKDFDPIGSVEKPPTPAEFDALLSIYEMQVKVAADAQKIVDDLAADLVSKVRKFGTKPETAAQSWRLEGIHSSATVTIGMTRSLKDPAILKLRDYLVEQGLPDLFAQLFDESKKYTLISGAAVVLAGVKLPERTREKMLALFGMCIDVKPNKPSLKVKAVTPQKPARKPRGGKKAA